MLKLKGKGVCAGIAVGVISYFGSSAPEVAYRNIKDANAELERVEKAKQTAAEQLSELYHKALPELGRESAEIFEIQRELINDIDYNNAIRNIITTQKVNAEYAVAVAADNFSAMLSAMTDDYMCARSADVKDVSQRIIRCLSGSGEKKFFNGKRIICAYDLTPSETFRMDRENVLAFVTARGSQQSHTAILARIMGIPSVIGIGRELTPECDGKLAVVDGSEGIIYIDPTQEILAQAEEKRRDEERLRQLAGEFIGRETVTKDGKKICLCANVGSAADIEAAVGNDAEGIGLLRSEFLYFECGSFPSEEVQFEAYRMAAEAMPGKKVIIRTIDIGADKQADYFGIGQEENPAMGYRGIRICLDRRDIFKTQLRALYRAAAYGRIAIMFPMIISAEEIKMIKDILAEVRSELRSEELEFDENIEIGIMIETPAAVMISDILAKEVDFFSIGTNDLTQYTLAVDRNNPALDSFYDPYHEAVKRMIKLAADNAHAAGIKVGVCGELGSDPNMTEWLLRAGIDELSVPPSEVLEIRRRICEIDLSAEAEEALILQTNQN